jgi:hypothetical protein
MYLLKIECIGDNISSQCKFYTKQINSMISGLGSLVFGETPERYSVYEVYYDRKNYSIKKVKLYPKKDYSKANSVGSRGVYAFYFLENGKMYEVKEPTSWRNTEHYFCKIENNELLRMTPEEAIKCLRNI